MVNSKERITEMEGVKLFLGLMGVVIYCLGMNLFIVPIGLYSGGFVGIGQIIRTLLVNILGFNFGNIDIAGIVYYIANVPLFIIAYKITPKFYFVKMIIATTAMAFLLSVIGIPQKPILDETITNCLIGGIICGFGAGTYLKYGCSTGGTEIIGIYFMKKNYSIGIGQLNMCINAVIYVICFMLFDVQTVVYSLIFSVINGLVLDKVHTQTVNVEAMIISKKNNDIIEQEILEKLQRGITYWDAYGGYTDEIGRVMYTVISKYEVPTLKRIVKKANPNAFTVFKEGSQVSGNFIRKL